MRLIDADKAISDYAHYGISHSYDAYDLEDIMNECPTIEAIPVTEKAFEMFETDYKNRLKADLKAILVELQLEIDKLPNHELQSSDWKQGFTHGLADVQEKVIQKKINELKEKDNGK